MENDIPGGHRPPALTTEAVLESINRLAAKIEASERAREKITNDEILAPLYRKYVAQIRPRQGGADWAEFSIGPIVC